MDDKLSIKVKIADREYPLRINHSEEENILKAVKFINDRVLQYKQKYVVKDYQDCLAMATMQIAFQKMDSSGSLTNSPFFEELERINDFLAEFIEKESIA